MRLTKRGLYYMVDFRLPSGRRVRLSTDVRVDAPEAQHKAYAAAVAIVSKECERTDAAPVAMTLALLLARTQREHWERMRCGKIMARTVGAITREVGALPVSTVTYAVLKDYAENLLATKMAPATVNRRMSAIGVALREAHKREEIPGMPPLPHYAERNVKERYVTEAEERTIIDWLHKMCEAERAGPDGDASWTFIRDLGVFLVDTGFRFSEAFKFTVTDGHADLGHGDTKTDKGRRVPLTRRAKVAAVGLLASPWLIRLRAMEERSRWDWCSHRWMRATKAAGCDDVTLHILRHTCASRLVQRGVSIYTVSKWLGHSSVKVTERYAKLAPDSLAGALSALQRGPVAADMESLQDTQLVHSRLDSTSPVAHSDEALPLKSRG